jgi:hypothetical protein
MIPVCLVLVLTDIAKGDDTIVIRTGLLEGTDKWGKPAAEIYDKFRASWLPQTGEHSFPMTPPS